MIYENRVALFIDILGFKEIVNSTLDTNNNDIEDRINYVYEIFKAIRYFLNIDRESDSETRRVTQFSDSIAISFLATEESEVFHTLYTIQLLITELVGMEILCRGGVSYGKLMHDDKVIFGPALNSAYDAESKKAKFPRIILDESIINLGGRFHASHHFPEHEIDSIKSIVTEDTDGFYYIDYFEKTLGNFNDVDYDPPEYIEQLRLIISRHMHSDDSRLKEKYDWLKTKFNRMVQEIKEYRSADGFHEEDRDLFEFYRSLEYL